MLIPSQLRQLAVALLSLSPSLVSASLESSNTTVKVLSDTFTPPQVFENENLVRNINLEKSYARETTNLVIKNVGKETQSEYYYLFPSEDVAQVGGLEVKDKKNAAAGAFKVELAQFENLK
jgi:oligosaccharyltransferase complex subunit alpha (ribophorin I)